MSSMLNGTTIQIPISFTNITSGTTWAIKFVNTVWLKSLFEQNIVNFFVSYETLNFASTFVWLEFVKLSFVWLEFVKLSFVWLEFVKLSFVWLEFVKLSFVWLEFVKLSFVWLEFVKLSFVWLEFVKLSFVWLEFVKLSFVGLEFDPTERLKRLQIESRTYFGKPFHGNSCLILQTCSLNALVVLHILLDLEHRL